MIKVESSLYTHSPLLVTQALTVSLISLFDVSLVFNADPFLYLIISYKMLRLIRLLILMRSAFPI